MRRLGILLGMVIGIMLSVTFVVSRENQSVPSTRVWIPEPVPDPDQPAWRRFLDSRGIDPSKTDQVQTFRVNLTTVLDPLVVDKSPLLLPVPTESGEERKVEFYPSPISVVPGQAPPDVRLLQARSADDPHLTYRASIEPDKPATPSKPATFALTLFVIGGPKLRMLEPTGIENVYALYSQDALSVRRDISCPFDYKSDQPIWPMGIKGARNTGAGAGDHRRLDVAVAGTKAFVDRDNYGGGNRPLAVRWILKSVNFASGILEREVGIELSPVVYDPLVHSADRPLKLQGDTQKRLQSFQEWIAKETTLKGQFDFAHVFDIGAESYGRPRTVCQADSASGITSWETVVLNNVDLFVHEVLHQFGAGHTFNAANFRHPLSAVEPGHGWSILSYIRPPGYLLHAKTMDEVLSFTSSQGAKCGTPISIHNMPPSIKLTASELNVPRQTPFVLRADGSDPDAAPNGRLVYRWDPMDRGPKPDAEPPWFRTYALPDGPVRSFPDMRRFLLQGEEDGNPLVGPSQKMTIRVTVRDDRRGFAFATANVTTRAEGPLVVTNPSSCLPHRQGSRVRVTWQTNGVEKLSAQARVRLLGADDLRSLQEGHWREGEILADAIDMHLGAAEVTIPADAPIGGARIKVEAATGQFYAISSALCIGAKIEAAPAK